MPPLLDVSWILGPYGEALPEAQQAWRAHIAECFAERDKVQAVEALLKNRSILGSREFIHAARRAARKLPRLAKKGAGPVARQGASLREKEGLTPLAA